MHATAADVIASLLLDSYYCWINILIANSHY